MLLTLSKRDLHSWKTIGVQNLTFCHKNSRLVRKLDRLHIHSPRLDMSIRWALLWYFTYDRRLITDAGVDDAALASERRGQRRRHPRHDRSLRFAGQRRLVHYNGHDEHGHHPLHRIRRRSSVPDNLFSVQGEFTVHVSNHFVLHQPIY